MQKNRQTARNEPSVSHARTPMSPSDSRSIAGSESGALVGLSEDIISSKRSHSQMQQQALPVPHVPNPRSSQVFSPPTSRRRQCPSLIDTDSISVSLSNKYPRLDVDEKLYPCLECKKPYPADGWYEHLVRVHFPEYIWTCGCRESKDSKLRKLWPRWGNFLKHVSERHDFKRSPAADASMKSRGSKVIGCYHHICGFCESPLPSRQSSLDHIKEHLDDGLQFEDWTHLCSSNHDVRSHVQVDLNSFPDSESKANRGPDDDEENSGDGNGSYGTHRRQDYGPSNTTTARGGERGPIRNQKGSQGYQSQSRHRRTDINHTDSITPEIPISSDLEDITLPFQSIRELGHGGYGTVDEVVGSSSKETYARKTIRSRKSSLHTTSYIAQLKNELRILKRLNHPHLIKLVGYYSTQNSFYIIMWPVAEVNLAVYIHRYISVTSPQRNRFINWMSCLASAVEYLHNQKIQHRDIKPQNILVKGEDIFLTDLGNAKLILDPEEVSAGKMIITPMYCAPETISEGIQDCKADIFSLGCVFTEMYSGCLGLSSQKPRSATRNFDTKPYYSRVRETQKYLRNLEDSQNQILTPRLVSLLAVICQMLEIDPAERPRASDLQSFFTDSLRCCCSRNSSRLSTITLAENVGLVPASQSCDLENSFCSTSKPHAGEISLKHPASSHSSSGGVSKFQDFAKPTRAHNGSYEIRHPRAAKLNPLGSANIELLSDDAQAKTDASQHLSRQLQRPGLREGISNSLEVTLNPLQQHQKHSARPGLRKLKPRSAPFSPSLIEIGEESVFATEYDRNVARRVGLRHGPLKAKQKETVAMMRRRGACVRCRLSKIRCSVEYFCRSCARQQQPECLRGRLSQYVEYFCPTLISEHLSKASLERLLAEMSFIGNEITIQVSSGPLLKSMMLNVHQILVPSQEALPLPYLTARSNKDDEFASIPTLQYALLDAEEDQIRQQCLGYIDAVSNCPLNDPETVLGDIPKIVWKSLEYIQRFSMKNPTARRGRLLQKASSLYWIQCIMSRTFTLSVQSAVVAPARVPKSSTVPSSQQQLSVRVLNWQIRAAFNSLFEECLMEILGSLENEYKSKTRDSWLLCYCINPILCLVVELVQNSVDSLILHKISIKGEDPAGATESGSTICQQLENLPIKHSWIIFFGLYKSFNPLKSSSQLGDNSGQDKDSAELIDAFRQMIRDNEGEILRKAAEACSGGTSQTVEQHKSFCARNTARHLSRFLEKIYLNV